MIINGFKCENCNEELQAEDIGVSVNDKGNLIRICRYCNHITEIQEQGK